MVSTGLKRVLGLPGATFIAVGFTVGGGVFVFTGIAARIVGPALPLAYGLAVIPVFITMLPVAMLGSAIPCTGGNYRYPSRLVSPGLAFVGIWAYALFSFFGQIPLYALSCAQYAGIYLPDCSPTLFAILLLTLFYIVNLVGVRPAATLQGLMVLTLVSALIYYGVRGLPYFDAGHFQNMFQRGGGNLALGVALLSFTYLGSNGLIELGGEIRNPGRVIPRAILIAFPLITALYLLVAISMVGAVPVTQFETVEEPLISAGRTFLGSGGRAFFITGGAILALTTTLNALFLTGTKSLLMMTEDGLLPAALGALNRRFGTPHVLLTAVWLLSVVGVLSGFSLETFASYATLGGMILFVPVLVAALILPRRLPQEYAASGFKLKGIWLWLCPTVGFAMVLFFSVVVLTDLGSILKVGMYTIFVLSGVAIYLWRRSHLLRRGIDLRALMKREDWTE